MAKDTPLFNLEDNKFEYGLNILGAKNTFNFKNDVYTVGTDYTPIINVF